jgi:hypothetical protein
MALRFYSELESSEGNVWKVEIHDDDFVDSAAEFTLASPGFTLSYTGGQDIFAPLMPSNCVVHMMVQNAAELQLVTDLSDFQEGRFLVRVIADPDDAADVHWVGMLTPESLGIADEYYPQAIDMRAICGLATLSRVDFSTGGHSFYGFAVLNRLYQSLGNIPTASLYAYDDIYLEVGTDVQPDTGDEFIEDVIMNAATFVEGAAGRVPGTVESKLSQIMRLMNSRLAMIRGHWVIMPISKMMDVTGVLTGVRRYREAGTLVSTGSELPFITLSPTTSNYRLAGWETSYLPAVRKVSRTLSYFGNAPFIYSGNVEFHPVGSSNSPQIVAGAYDASASLSITDTITITADLNISQLDTAPVSGDAHLVRYRIELLVRVGAKYLKRFTPFDYSTTQDSLNGYGDVEIFNPGVPAAAEWTADSADRVTVFSEWQYVHSVYNDSTTKQVSFSFDSPPIGTAEDADVDVIMLVRGYHGVASASHPTAYLTALDTQNNCTLNGKVALYIGGTGDNGDHLLYTATIANGATEELEIPPSQFGEVTADLFPFNPGGLQIYTGNPDGFTSAGTTGSTPINELLCLDYLRHLAKQQEQFRGAAVCGSLVDPFNLIKIDLNRYMITQMSMTAQEDTYDFELTLVRVLSESDPNPGAEVRTTTLPLVSTSGASTSASEGARAMSLQHTAAIADAIESAEARTDALVINDMGDVDTVTRAPADGDVLEWVASVSEWQPLPPSGGGASDNLESQDQQIVDGTTRVIDVSSAGAPATALEIKAGSVVLARFASSVFGILTEATFSPLSFQVNSALLLKGNTSALSGQVSMYENSANGSELVAWKAPAAIASSFVLVLPDAPPTADGQLMSFASSGGLATASFVKNWQYIVLQSAFYASTTSRIYIPLTSGTQSESTSVTSSYVLHPCPFDGEIVRIAHSGYGGGSTDVTTHLNQSTTPLETINTTLAGGGYTNVTEVNFTVLSAFSKGDIIHIGMDGTTMLGTSRVAVVLRYDTTT